MMHLSTYRVLVRHSRSVLRDMHVRWGSSDSCLTDEERQKGAIFFHIPKAAGVSLALTLFGERVGHRYATRVRRQDPAAFDTFLKFTFVRNPWDRMVSAFHFLQQGGLTVQDAEWAARNLGHVSDFRSFLASLQDPRWRRTVMSWKHFKPQYKFVCDPRGRCLVDFVGKYEHLSRDFMEIAANLNVPQDIPRVNRSHRGEWRDYYDGASIDLVGQLYKKDITIFGYESERPEL